MEPALTRFILLVEDHPSTADVMARMMRARGFSVLAATSLAEARKLASDHDIGFVISDLGLADGNGWELMAELHRQSGINGAAVSGFGMEADMKRSREAGFILHLVKPIQIGELEHLLTVARSELDQPPPPAPGNR